MPTRPRQRRPSISDIQRLAVERTVYGYAEEYLHLEDGSKFSFKNHNYLVDIYLDLHPYIVIEKSAQMGASIYAIAKAFAVCDKMSKNTIYFFPTDTDVMDFSKTRVGPIVANSPHLSEVTGRSDSLGLRQVNNGWLYFRGMRSKVAMKSIPADFLIFDELDEVPEGAEALADQRLNHSSLRWRLKLSTPTYENFGIDREFKNSDQRYWNLVCRACQTRNIMEFQFPECVRRFTPTKCGLICRRCKRELDPQYGEWIAEKPSVERIRGYHICGLYSSFLDLSDMMYEFEGGRRRDEFMRSKLGLPWVSAEQRITRDMVQRCYSDYEMHIDYHTFMGVDQKGDQLHLTIRKPNRISGKSEVILVGRVRTFDLLDDYMRRYDIDLCVIDGTPNQHSARDFSRRFPGRVYLCFYQDTQKGEYAWRESTTTTGLDYMVIVNRTEALDAMYEQIGRREVAFPRPTKDVEELTEQLTNLARENVEDDDGTIKGAVWKRLGPDHFAHSLSYSLIAQSKYGTQTPSSIVVQSPIMARILKPGRQVVTGRY
jgi:hypothetical protein